MPGSITADAGTGTQLQLQGQDQVVYQGRSITGIRDLAETLGADVKYDPQTGNVSVNGTVVPYMMNVNGTTYGSVNDIAAAAGGKVTQNADGSYSVTKAASSTQTAPAGGTPVTGNPATAGATGASTALSPLPPELQASLDAVKRLAAAGDTQAAAQQLAQIAGVSQQQATANLQTYQQAGGATPVTGNPNTPAAAAQQAGAAGPVQPQQPQGPPLLPTYPTFSFQNQPIDYNALRDRAALLAGDWAAPQVQRLKDLADAAQQQYDQQRGYVNQDLADQVASLREGEAAREQRVNEDMNRRGDAIYNSGVRFAGIAQQQQNAYNKELGLNQKAAAKLSKLADDLGLKLSDIASRGRQLAAQQGNKALLTFQQLADKAQTQQFQNRQLAWQMWLQGAQLDQKQQQMANTLWLGVQQIKSADDRAAADRDLRLAIANGQLEQKYAQMQLQDDQFNARLAFDQQSEADRQEVERLKLALDADKFDWQKQSFLISEQDKVDYQNQLVALRQQGLLNDQDYRNAQLEIQKGELSVKNAQLIETNRHNQAQEQIAQTSAQAKAVADQASTQSTAWKSLMGELQGLNDPYKTANQSAAQRQAAAQSIVSKWTPQLSPQDQAALKGYLKAVGLMQ